MIHVQAIFSLVTLSCFGIAMIVDGRAKNADLRRELLSRRADRIAFLGMLLGLATMLSAVCLSLWSLLS